MEWFKPGSQSLRRHDKSTGRYSYFTKINRAAHGKRLGFGDKCLISWAWRRHMKGEMCKHRHVAPSDFLCSGGCPGNKPLGVQVHRRKGVCRGTSVQCANSVI